MSVAGEDTRPPPLQQHLTAKAVIFDFVNPLLAFGRLIDRGSQLRLDESEPVNDAGHGPDLASKTGEFESEVGWGLLQDGLRLSKRRPADIGQLLVKFH